MPQTSPKKYHIYNPRSNMWIQATEAEMPERDSPNWKALTGGGGTTTNLSPKGRPYTEHTYQQVCWHPKRQRFFISTMKKGFFKFDVPDRTLTPIESPDAFVRCQSLSYDKANKVVVSLATRKVDKYRQAVLPWMLDVETQKWRKMNPKGQAPVGQTAGAWATFWYDPEHNVHLLINCVRRDRHELFDGGVTEVWAYRYKNAAD